MKKKHLGAVFCDLDETLYPGATIKDVASYLAKHGQLGVTAYGKILWWLFLKSIDRLNDEAAFAAGVELLAGWKITDLEEEIRQAYQSVLRPKMNPAIFELTKGWRETSGPLVVATESLSPIAQIFAPDLGATVVLGTKLEIIDGRVTGKLAGPVLQGEAKAAAVRAWAMEHHIDLKQSLAIGGRLDDVSLLKLTGHALVLNPDQPLRLMAEHSGWQIVDI